MGPQAAEPEHHHHSVLDSLRDRAISVRTMDWRVRIVTLIVAVQGVLVAAMVVDHGARLGLMNVSAVHDQLALMPSLIFWSCVGFTVIAWAYVLAGAFHGHLVLRPLAIGVFVFTSRPLWDLAAQAWAPAHFAVMAALVGLAALGLGTWVLDLLNRRRGAERLAHHHRLRLPTAGLTLLLLTAVFAGTWVADQHAHAPLLFSESIYNHLYTLTDFLVPMLLLTAVDFTDVGYAGSEVVTRLAGRVRPPYVTAAAAAVAAILIMAWLLEINPRHPFPFAFYWQGDLEQLAYGGLALVGGVLLVRRAGPALGGGGVPYVAIAVAAVLAYGVNYLALQLILPRVLDTKAGITSAGSVLTAYNHTAAPVFSIRYPAPWEVKATEPATEKDLGLYSFNGLQTGLAGVFYVVVVRDENSEPAAVAANGRSLVSLLKGDLKGDFVASGDWQQADYSTNQGAVLGRIWVRQKAGYFWGLVGNGNSASFPIVAPTFQEMVQSWSPSLAPGGRSHSSESAASVIQRVTHWLSVGQALFWLAVALAAAALLVGIPRWRWSGAPAALVFAYVFGILTFGPHLRALATAGADSAHVKLGSFPHAFGTWALTWTVAIGTLLAVAYWAVRRRHDPRWRRLLGMLLLLELALVVVDLMYWGYGREISANGQFPVLAALVIILALAWDVVMSGDSITNRHSVHFPRHTRVMLLMGYEMLVSTAVLFLSSLQVQATGGAVESLFESDRYPQSGLIQLAIPVVLVLFLLQVGAGLAPRGGGAEEPAAA